MLAEFFEKSVMFQNDTVYMMYGIIFVVLGLLCLAAYISDCKKYED